jgi:putative DNA primase/helicase
MWRGTGEIQLMVARQPDPLLISGDRPRRNSAPTLGTMTAAEVASALGGACRPGGWWRCRCPVHASRGSTLALRDGERGLIVHCHAGCSRTDILAELRRRGLLHGDAGVKAPANLAEIERRRNAEARDRQRRIAFACNIIASALPATATVVERYLHTRVPGIAGVPPPFRYLPIASPYARHPPSGGRRPVMVATVEHVEHGVVGAHRTWLAVDGSAKASFDPARMSTGAISGGAVWLASAAETLMVGEGIETTLSAMMAIGLPGWAALSTSGLVALVLPSIVTEVIILADNDATGAGEKAARAAAQRWLAEGRKVRLAMPPNPGTDFNDVLRGSTSAGVQEMNNVAA